MIQQKQHDSTLIDEPRAIPVDDTPFAVVPVQVTDNDEFNECWSLLHVPCCMATGNDPGWWSSRQAKSDVARWWRWLTMPQREAFRGTNIDEMRLAGCDKALDELIELADFRLVGGE